MKPHRAPKTTAGWEKYDNNQQSWDVTDYVKRIMEQGTPPRPDDKTPMAVLNGMFVGVLEFCPSLLEQLCSNLESSIDSSMNYLKTSQDISIENFRRMFFGVVHRHNMTSQKAKDARAMNFNQFMKFKRDDSPLGFYLLLKKEQAEVNDMNISGGVEPINDSMVRSVFCDQVEAVASDLYDQTLNGALYPLTMGEADDEPPPMPLDRIVHVLEKIYMDKRNKKRLHLAFGVDHTTPEAISDTNSVSTSSLSSMYSDKSNSSNPSNVGYPNSVAPSDTSYQQTIGSSNDSLQSGSIYGLNGKPYKQSDDKSLKQKPCFNMRDRKNCPFGDKCKYSHDPAIMNRVNLSAEDLVEQFAYVTQTFQRRQNRTGKRLNKLNKFKQKYKQLSKSGKPKSNKDDVKDRLKSSNVTYEDAAKLDPTTLAAIDGKSAETSAEMSDGSTYESDEEDSITDEN